MTALDRICGQVLKDTDEGAIYVGYDRKTDELYAGYVAGNAAISRNWTVPYDADQPLDAQLRTLIEKVNADVNK